MGRECLLRTAATAAVAAVARPTLQGPRCCVYRLHAALMYIPTFAWAQTGCRGSKAHLDLPPARCGRLLQALPLPVLQLIESTRSHHARGSLWTQRSAGRRREDSRRPGADQALHRGWFVAHKYENAGSSAHACCLVVRGRRRRHISRHKRRLEVLFSVHCQGCITHT